jgi:hypothetical protein
MPSSIEIVVYLALLGSLVLWLVLPVIPAFLLYRFFPNQTIAATGVLANFKVNATGAFAGYLVLFAAMIPFMLKTYDTVGAFLHPYWTIRGQITLHDRNGKEIHQEALFRQITPRTHPEMSSFEDPVFVIGLPEADQDFPDVVLEIPNWGRGLMTIRSLKMTRDYFRKTIQLQTPLVITEDAHYVTSDSHPQ